MRELSELIIYHFKTKHSCSGFPHLKSCRTYVSFHSNMPSIRMLQHNPPHPYEEAHVPYVSSWALWACHKACSWLLRGQLGHHTDMRWLANTGSSPGAGKCVLAWPGHPKLQPWTDMCYMGCSDLHPQNYSHRSKYPHRMGWHMTWGE